MAETGTNILKAKNALQKGGLVGIPTETVYGLAANAFDPQAVAGIFEAKNRPAFDPLIVHVPDLEKASELVTEFPEYARTLASVFWPGPLTLLLPKNEKIPDIVTSGMPDVAIRVPDNELTLRLLAELDFPLVAPSANPFGYISPTTAGHVNDQLGESVDYVLDGGPCQVGVESTIIGFQGGIPTIFRKGGLSVEAIEATIGKVRIMAHSTSNPKAPGMLKSHYAPKTPVRFGSDTDPEEWENTGLLSFGKPVENKPGVTELSLSETGDLREAARNLFGHLRRLDNLGLKIIFVNKVPDEGLGRAINDRLSRAAAE